MSVDPTARVTMRRRQAVADDVYDAVKHSILTNRLPAGSKINLDEIARDIGVSNTPIRQALSRLEAEGFVIKEPYKGFTVSDLLDGALLENVFEVRLVIEPLAASLAAARHAPGGLDRLSELVGAAAVDPSDAGDLDAKFHETIALSTGNFVLAEEITRLQQRTAPYRFTYDLSGWASEAWREHAEILQAITAADAGAAHAAMRRHVEQSRDRFRGIRSSQASLGVA